MASINLLEPYFKVSIDARPSNYLINHVSFPALNEIVNWSELRVVRNTSGFPQNINDGVQIFSELSDSIVITVGATASTSLYLANPVATFTYSGGGVQSWPSTAGDYIYYNVIAQSATSGSGTGAKFDIVRSKVDGSIKSVTLNSGGGGYAVGNTITIPAASIGYDATIAPLVTDLIVTVSTLGNPSGGLKPTLNTSWSFVAPGKTYTNSANTYGDTATTASYVSGVAAVTTGNATGSGATFKVVRDASGVYTLTLVSSGKGYKTGDVLRIPGSSIGGRSSTTVLGQTQFWHVFDNGTATGLTSNPGYGVVGSNIYKPYNSSITVPTQYPRYYYGVFVKYTIDTKINGQVDTVSKWRKIGEVSSVVVTDGSTTDTSGNLIRSSTLTNILGHLPQFYVANGVTENKDLKAFLSLFVFHIDTYLANIRGVSNMADTTLIDEQLIKLWLKQFGVNYKDINNVTNARKLLSSIIRNYKYSGIASTLANTAEQYSGYGTTVTSGINLLPDYNTSSFLETTGAWYSDPAYPTTLAWDYPISGSIASYANLSGPTLTGVSSSGNVFTCDSTAGLKSGDVLTKSAGTGAFATPAIGSTVVTTVVDDTHFKVNQTTATAFSGATVYSSSNLVGGMLKVTGTGSANVNVGLGLKRVKLNGATSTSSKVITVYTTSATGINVGDYVINPLIGNTSPNPTTGFAYETSVTNFNAANGQVTLSVAPTAIVATDTELWFAPAPIADKAGAASALVAVQQSQPYSFSVRTNAGANTVRTTVVSMKWYDINGNIISTTSSASSPATLTSPGANTWGLAQISGVAPTNAAYVQPNITINALGASSYWIDAASVEGALPVLQASVSGTNNTTVSLTTTYPHYFTTGNFVSVSGLGAPYDGTFIISSTPAGIPYTIQYTVASNSAATINNLGYMASANSNFEDAKQIKITPLADRINLIVNPSFETSTNYWGTNNATVATTSGGLYGNSALQVTCATATTAITGVYAGTSTDGATRIPTLPGYRYVFSAYVKNIDVTGAVQASVDWYSLSTGGSVYTSAYGEATSITTSGWTRVSVTVTAPVIPTATVMYARPKIYTIQNVSNGKQLLVDAVLFEISTNATPSIYFDGSYDGQNYEANRDSMWEGTAHASRSHFYTNRVAASGKLDSILTNGIYYA